jgi:hypothetical protein
LFVVAAAKGPKKTRTRELGALCGGAWGSEHRMIEYIEVFCEYIELDAFGQIEMAARTRFLAADQKVPCSLFLEPVYRNRQIAEMLNAPET